MEPQLLHKFASLQTTNSWKIKESDTDANSVRKELAQSGYDIYP